jgi:hypothetical protein
MTERLRVREIDNEVCGWNWALGMDAVSFGISALIVLNRIKPSWFAAGLAGQAGRTVVSNAR